MSKAMKVVLVLLAAGLIVAGYTYYKRQSETDREKALRAFNRALDSWAEKIYRAMTAEEPIEGWESWWNQYPHVRSTVTKQQARNHAHYQIMQNQSELIPIGYIIIKNEGTGNWSLVEE